MMSAFYKENLSFISDKFSDATGINDLFNSISATEIFFFRSFR